MTPNQKEVTEITNRKSHSTHRGDYGAVRSMGVYAIGVCLQQAAGIVVLPLLLTHLSTAQLGAIAVGELVVSLLTGLMGFGLQSAVMRFHGMWSKSGQAEQGSATVWYLNVLISCLIALVFLASAAGLAPIFRSIDLVQLSPILVALSLVTALNQIPFVVLRVRDMPAKFAVASVLIATLGMVLTYAFVARMKMGIEGFFLAQLLGAGCGLIALIKFSGIARTWLFAAGVVRESLRFSTPLIPVALHDATASRLDRFFLDRWVDVAEVGVYCVAQKIASGARLLPHSALKMAWWPLILRLESSRENPAEEIRETLSLVWLANCFFAGVTFLTVPLVLQFVDAGSYGMLPTYMITCVGYNLLLNLDAIFAVAPFLAKRSKFTMLATFLQLGLFVGLNLLLVRKFGAVGSGVATCVSLGITALVRRVYGERRYRIPFRKGDISLPLIGCFMLSATGYFVSASIRADWMRLILLMFFAFLTLVYCAIVSMRYGSAKRLMEERFASLSI